MIHKRIDLNGKGAFLVTYVHDKNTQLWDKVGEWAPEDRPAIIVNPGGRYFYCSEREGEPIAFPFLNAGYNVFVLYYRTAEASVFPAPLEDVSLAIWHIRQNAKEYNTNPDKIAVAGFSAGGNLASMIATQWYRGDLAERLGIPEGGNRPNAVILGYAPTNLERRIVPNMTVGAIYESNPPEVTTVNYIDEHTPPCFIWHTMEDENVPVSNAIGFAAKCLENHVPFELHIFQNGPHGLSLNTDLTGYKLPHPVNVESWVPMCINWMNKLFDF